MITITVQEWKLSKLRYVHGRLVPDRATAEWDGRQFEAVSANGASMKLARLLVAGGCPDQPWQTVGVDGQQRLRGTSLHDWAKWTIQHEPTPRRIPYKEHPNAHVPSRTKTALGDDGAACIAERVDNALAVLPSLETETQC